MLNATFQSHPIKMVCCSTNEKSLIVTTINSFWRSHPIHPGLINLTFVAFKARKTSSLHTNFISKQNTYQESHCFDFYLSIVFLVKGLDTLNQL